MQDLQKNGRRFVKSLEFAIQNCSDDPFGLGGPIVFFVCFKFRRLNPASDCRSLSLYKTWILHMKHKHPCQATIAWALEAAKPGSLQHRRGLDNECHHLYCRQCPSAKLHPLLSWVILSAATTHHAVIPIPRHLHTTVLKDPLFANITRELPNWYNRGKCQVTQRSREVQGCPARSRC
jgi:hypothetical protein